MKNTLTRHLSPYNDLYLGFSGGLDSTVLLHQIASIPKLKPKLMPIHINHGLSPNANLWEVHCQKICDELGLPLIIKRLSLSKNSNIEEEARKARYAAFQSVIKEGSCLILGHHQQDQAETILLQLLRGTGIDGLAAMTQQSFFANATLFRPLLEMPHEQIKVYASTHKLSWIEDESNQDTAFSRNFLRKEIMRTLMKRWPQSIANFARTATHCQQAKNLLNDLALIDCPDLPRFGTCLPYASFQHLSKDRIVNIIRHWLKLNQVKPPSSLMMKRMIDELIHGRIDSQPMIAWGLTEIKRYDGRLYLLQKSHQKKSEGVLDEWLCFPQPMKLPKENKILEAKKSTQGIKIRSNTKIYWRYRKGGEVIRLHQQTKSLKKLFQVWKIPQWQRDNIPLLFIDNELVMVPGFAIADHYFSKDCDEHVFEICCSNLTE